MTCSNCNSERILKVYGKCGDLTNIEYMGVEKQGYIPEDLGIGNGDYIKFSLCLDCGKIQGRFPAEDPEFYIASLEEE